MRKIGIIIFAVLGFAGLASAQIPSGNVFLGYSYESMDSSGLDFAGANRANLNGWEASAEGKIIPWIGFVADFAGHYGTPNYQFALGGTNTSVNVSSHEFEALFGPRVSIPIGKFRPFAEALFGLGHITTNPTSGAIVDFQNSDTSFATALGGGIDYRVIKPIAWRFQGDYVQTRFFGATQNNVRLSTGIVLRF